MVKKILSALLTIGILASYCLMNVSAYVFPNSFWRINDAYIRAVDENDYDSIIKYGLQEIDFMKNESIDDETVLSIMADRTQRLAEVYAEIGMYHESAEMYEFFLPYGEKIGWKDSVIIAKAKIPQYKTSVELYTDNGCSPYYIAKNEPENGILFGLAETGQTSDLIGNESAILIYYELGVDSINMVDLSLKTASDKGLAVELAVNCPNEGTDIAYFDNIKYDIESLSAIIKKYSNIPVFFRFGAEFNIWENQADPEQYKEAFRYVHNYVKQNNTNVATVWSPNAVSRWGDEMNDFYPGDEYVDWVGVSLYLMKYFLGDPNSPEFEEAYFKTGLNSDPVLIMKEVIEKYGDRKPIMISESGQSAFVNSAYVSEDTTEWAIQKMKEFYSYLPMVYPQIKFIAHFDAYVNNEVNNYCLSSNPPLQKQYVELVKSPRFIKSGNNNATMCYRKIFNDMYSDDILPVSCYAHIYNDSINSVTYFIDDAYNSVSFEIPYTACLDLKNISSGLHTIKAVIDTANGQNIVKEYEINTPEKQNISVIVDGNKVEFEQPPLLHNGKTMVALRPIFDAIGASVEWNEPTQTVKAKKGANEIEFTINSDILRKNGKPIYLDVSAMLVGDYTVIPVRAIAESFDLNVVWDDASHTVIITK